MNDGKDGPLVGVDEKLVVEETVSLVGGNAITGGEDKLVPLPDPEHRTTDSPTP